MGLEKSVWCVDMYLRALTCLTSLYVAFDVQRKARPPIVPRDELLRLEATRMSRDRRIMVLAENIRTQGIVSRYVQPVLIKDQACLIGLPAWQAQCEALRRNIVTRRGD